jgi:hypothetical protein
MYMYKSMSVFILTALFMSSVSAENYMNTGATTIDAIVAYHSSNADGDIRIKTAVSMPGCEDGYLLLKGTEGLNASLSIALSAFHAGSSVKIFAYSGRTWRGTSNPAPRMCHLEGIHLNK